ncbi:hypothetical protein SCB29_41250, partial [Paraburkholderia sp. SIMBA_055]
GKRLDPSNFRRLLEGSEALVPTEDFRTGPHRPARLFQYNADVDLAAPALETDRQNLIALIKDEAVFHGDFTLSSGKKATY